MEFGRTRVLCAASVTEGVPRWRKGTGSGWVTAEYSMLPRATTTRGDREAVKGKMGGRTHEISRRAGRRAARARVGRLVLTHLPPWTDPDTVRAEAARAYDGPIDLAHPGQNWDI